jgi:hypothetical protein
MSWLSKILLLYALFGTDREAENKKKEKQKRRQTVSCILYFIFTNQWHLKGIRKGRW